MDLSPAGRAFLIEEEGKYPKVYADLDGESNKRKGLVSYAEAEGKGWPTIGIGHLIYYQGSWSKDERARFAGYLRDGGSMTEQQMQALLDEDLGPYISRISQKLQVPVTQNQFDALVVMAFNTGMGNKNFKLALDETNNGNWRAASEAIAGGPIQGSGSDGVLPGLVNRRQKEAELYLKDLVEKGGLSSYMLPTLFVSSIVFASVLIYRKRRG